MLIDFLRLCRKTLYAIGHAQVFGFNVDFLLHFFVACVLAVVLRRWLSVRKTSLLIIILMVVKESFDIFAKSRIEYIRPPALDSLVDLAAGLIGLYLGLTLVKSFPHKRPAKDQ